MKIIGTNANDKPNTYEDLEVKLNPSKEAFVIAVKYMIIGCLWILFSDSLLNFFVKDIEVLQKMQLVKGWIYVLITGVYIHLLVYLRMKLLRQSSEKLQEGYNNMASINEELLEKEEEIYNLAYYDRLTKLYNWTGLSIAFDDLLNNNQNEKYAVLYIDVDNIKHINDTLGHDKGNLLLKYISERLLKVVSEDEIISRISGDEFVVIIKYNNFEVDLNKKVAMINNHIKTTWKFDRYEFFVTTSIGIAIFPEHGNTLETLIKNSDAAMFKAKNLGKNQHYIYNENISQKTENYIEIISQIRHGINKHEFLLYYQPIVDLRTRELVAVEALIRWQHPIRGFLTPKYFIDVAEESGQINEIGKWVFDDACAQHRKWREKGYKKCKISVNLSGKRLFSHTLIEDLKSALEFNLIDSGMIQIEITETSVIENIEKAIRILNEMRELGIKLALDDFGTGYSSLTYLQTFPIDVLKIDREFIKNISVGELKKENDIINAVISLAHSLDLEIIAEGIELEEQADYLLDNSCEYGQGYFYDRPMTAEMIEEKYFKNK